MQRKYIFIKAMGSVLTLSMALFSQPLLTDTAATYSYAPSGQPTQNFKLGLYEGTNTMPAEHLADGLEIARAMRNMSKITIVDMGHSVPNTTFSGWSWTSAVKSQYGLASNLEFHDGAIGAHMAWDWINDFKGNISTIGGVAVANINVLVIQLTWAPFMGPDDYEKNTPLQTKIDSMAHDLSRLCQNAKKKLPNLKMILLEADPWQNNHEPYHAYHEWFFSRQVVLNQIKNDKTVDLSYKGDNSATVWLDLGGYWWMKNADSKYYTDCCHISAAGQTYYRDIWLKALLKDPVLATFLLANPPTAVAKKAMPTPLAPSFNAMSGKHGIEISFTLPYSSQIGLSLLSTKGQTIIPSIDKTYPAGANKVTLTTPKSLTPGMYIVKMKNGSNSQTMRVTTFVR